VVEQRRATVLASAACLDPEDADRVELAARYLVDAGKVAPSWPTTGRRAVVVASVARDRRSGAAGVRPDRDRQALGRHATYMWRPSSPAPAEATPPTTG